MALDWITFGVVFVATFLMVSTGHGRWMDLGHVDKPVEDETMEFAIKWLYGRVNEYWYDL